MKAAIGDQIVVRLTRTGTARRDGEVVGLRHADGTPPFDVRWSDNGRTTVFFPGPDAHAVHPGVHPGHGAHRPADPA